MHVHYLQHAVFEGLGSIAAWLEERGHSATAVHLYRGDPLPAPDAVEWLIVMGGPMGVYDDGDCPWLAAEREFIAGAIAGGRRVLGVCLGAQLMAAALGARVSSGACREIGWHSVYLTPEGRRSALFEGLPDAFEAFHWHSDSFAIPARALHAAYSRACAHQALVYGPRALGLQFHLETTAAAARDMLVNCGDPGDPQDGALLADPRRFAALRPVLWRILDNLQHA